MGVGCIPACNGQWVCIPAGNGQGSGVCPEGYPPAWGSVCMGQCLPGRQTPELSLEADTPLEMTIEAGGTHPT